MQEKFKICRKYEKNLVEMLDELKLNKKLYINSCVELFENRDDLLHTTSIIPYPVFIDNKNYTGSNPKILDDELLYSYTKEYFYKEVEEMKDTLIIPLGKSVEEVLKFMIEENLIKRTMFIRFSSSFRCEWT